MEEIINIDFIDKIRCGVLAYRNWGNFKEDYTSNEIVPENISHSYLMSNQTIDNNILEFYCSPCLVSDNEFMEMNKNHIFGKKETLFLPYSNMIFGAFHKRADLCTMLNEVLQIPTNIKDKRIEFFEDLEPYFIEYADGFKNGFNEFENTIIKPYLTLLADKQDYANKVFEYLTKTIFPKHDWANQRHGFTRKGNNIVDGFEQGQKQGFFYKAWSIVFSNNNQFAPLFKDLMQPKHNILKEQETKTDKLKTELDNYGFFNLQMIMQLSEDNKQIIIELISTKGLPYSIAMFEYLGFLKHLEKNQFKSKYQLNKEVSKWFNSDKEGRAVKGNISTLSEYSTENKTKYTAHLHKKTVQSDYQNLKKGVPPYCCP